jgi:hypothetical protein
MSHRDSINRLIELVEVDDAYIGANKTDKAGSGGGQTPVLVAIEKSEEGKPAFVAIELLDSLSKSQVINFAKRRLQPGAVSHTDAFPTLSDLAVQSTHIAKITSLEQADEWLPWVHVVISNLKRFLLGTGPTTTPFALIGSRNTSLNSSIGSPAGSGSRRSPTVFCACVSSIYRSPCMEHEPSTGP